MKLLLVLLQSINILWFGHSYGVDSTELLPQIASEAGVENLYIGRFVKGNCSLEEHYDFYLSDKAGRYSECAPGETEFKKVPKSVREAVGNIKWDYVIFQNSLENEGRYETAQPYLDSLVAFVRNTQKEKFGFEPAIGWNMFWPISRLREDGSNKLCTYRLSFYGNSSDRMWEEYMDATKMLVMETGINLIIPTGTAVMNARATSLNDADAKDFTRDGYHLSYDRGRYIAACTVFEKLIAPLIGQSVLGNTCRPQINDRPELTGHEASVFQRCAVAAVEKPYEVISVSKE